MKKLIDQNDLNEFRARFNTCYDSVLLGFSCQTPAGMENTSCTVELRCMDYESDSGWCNLTLKFNEVTAWRFAMDVKTIYFIISDGMHIRLDEGLIYVDMGYYSDPVENISEYFDSEFFFVTKDFEWESVAI